VEIGFPIEFIVVGTPVSFQGKVAKAKAEWKDRVKAASSTVLPTSHFASGDRIAATLFYFPDGPMQGDVDNIVKLVLDGMSRHVYINDSQVERIVVQKFEPGSVFEFASLARSSKKLSATKSRCSTFACPTTPSRTWNEIRIARGRGTREYRAPARGGGL
jgi:hypothetical protein